MAIKIKYNGAVIASLGAGQTITLKCAGMKMLSDVVVEADEQGGNDKPSIAAGLYTDNTYSTMTTSWQELLDAGVVHVDDGVVYTNYDRAEYWANSSSDALVGVLVLPDDGSVTKIGNYYQSEDSGVEAFAVCRNLTGILIPDTVTTICDYAFLDCSALLSVEIPSSVSGMGKGAFQNCTGLSSVIFDKNSTLESIGESTFGNCESLPHIELPNTLACIDPVAFQYCTTLVNIEIPSNVTILGYGAFMGCHSLTNIQFGSDNKLHTIEYGAFSECTSMLTITIPSGVTYIGDEVFTEGTNLTSLIVMAETPPTVGEYLFAGSENPTEIKVPASSVDAYKAADGWSDYADIIVAI